MKLGFKSEGQVLPDNIPQTDLMNIIKVRLQAGVVGVVGYAGREGGRHRTGGVVGEEKETVSLLNCNRRIRQKQRSMFC